MGQFSRDKAPHEEQLLGLGWQAIIIFRAMGKDVTEAVYEDQL